MIQLTAAGLVGQAGRNIKAPPGDRPSGRGGMQRAGQGGGIFVSYSRKHEDLVTPLVRLLRLGDRPVFQDVDSVPLAQSGTKRSSIL